VTTDIHVGGAKMEKGDKEKGDKEKGDKIPILVGCGFILTFLLLAAYLDYNPNQEVPEQFNSGDLISGAPMPDTLMPLEIILTSQNGTNQTLNGYIFNSSVRREVMFLNIDELNKMGIKEVRVWTKP
jgi:hypothetical protein